MESDLHNTKAELASNLESVNKLECHIKNLLEDLADAQLATWRTQKRKKAVERSIVMLNKVWLLACQLVGFVIAPCFRNNDSTKV